MKATDDHLLELALNERTRVAEPAELRRNVARTRVSARPRRLRAAVGLGALFALSAGLGYAAVKLLPVAAVPVCQAVLR